MDVRFKKSGTLGSSNTFNIQALAEVIVSGDFGADSVYIHDLDVWIESLHEWKDMGEAFSNHDIITDNYNTIFFEPKNADDKERGFTL